jgi:hypothetical protein
VPGTRHRSYGIVRARTHTFTTTGTAVGDAQGTGINPLDGIFRTNFNAFGTYTTLPAMVEHIEAINRGTIEMKACVTVAGSTTGFT